MEERIIKLLAEILELDPETITEDLSASYCSEWDSLASMAIMRSLEKEFDIKFSFEDLMELDSVGNIIRVVSKKKNENYS